MLAAFEHCKPDPKAGEHGKLRGLPQRQSMNDQVEDHNLESTESHNFSPSLPPPIYHTQLTPAPNLVYFVSFLLFWARPGMSASLPGMRGPRVFTFSGVVFHIWAGCVYPVPYFLGPEYYVMIVYYYKLKRDSTGQKWAPVMRTRAFPCLGIIIRMKKYSIKRASCVLVTTASMASTMRGYDETDMYYC